MSVLTETVPVPDRKGLREFALVVSATLAALFGLFFPWLLGFEIPLWPWLVGGVLAAWGLVAPASLGPVYVLWMRLGLVLHRIVSPLVLGLIFFVLFTPIALGMRLFGRDTMHRSFDKDASTYRSPGRSRKREDVEKPF